MVFCCCVETGSLVKNGSVKIKKIEEHEEQWVEVDIKIQCENDLESFFLETICLR